MKIRKGFTLIEVLIVISITAMLFLVGYANFRGYSRRQALVGVTKQLQADVRLAQAQAIEGKKPASGCSVIDGYRVTFTASSYTINPICNGWVLQNPALKTVTLSQFGDFEIVTPIPPPVTFKALGHGTDIGVNTAITITLRQISSQRTSLVRITDGGYISVDEVYVLNTPLPTPTWTPTPGPQQTATAAPATSPPGPTLPPPTSPPPAPTPVNTTCYRNLDGDIFLGASAVRPVLNGQCSNNSSGDGYIYNANGLPTDCSDVAGHTTPGNVNLCCWTQGGSCNSNCNNNSSTSISGIRDCSAGVCAAGSTSRTCYNGSSDSQGDGYGQCLADGVGSCYVRQNYNSHSPYANNCALPCQLTGNLGNCYESRAACQWSW